MLGLYNDISPTAVDKINRRPQKVLEESDYNQFSFTDQNIEFLSKSQSFIITI